jgi:hypothetical protein
MSIKKFRSCANGFTRDCVGIDRISKAVAIQEGRGLKKKEFDS